MERLGFLLCYSCDNITQKYLDDINIRTLFFNYPDFFLLFDYLR